MPPVVNFPRPFLQGRAPFSWVDIPVALGAFVLVWAFVSVGADMTSPVLPDSLEIDLGIVNLPYYCLRSIVRMFIAYAWSLAFTFVFGSLAAHNRTAERIIIPTIDILQSVPVLGFLAVTVNGFMALFPGSVFGIELAAIFAIFTSQVWNIIYSFFQSVRSIPRDLSESATIFRLRPFQRFVRLEIPSSMIGLVWNSMVSFGGGWFFLAASEAITVLGKDIRLPGIGSYLATAVEVGDFTAVAFAIGAMLAIVILLDFFFFRPLLAWAQKFSQGGGLDQGHESVVLTVLQRSAIIEWIQERIVDPAVSLMINRIPARLASIDMRQSQPRRRGISFVGWIFLAVAMVFFVLNVFKGLSWVVTSLSLAEFLDIVGAGIATLARVLATVAIGTIIWVPIGTYIGARPELARRLRPIIQVGAAFPANLVFPLMVLLFVRIGLDISYGAVLLMLLSTQWYILFNVIVGALTIPEDLREAASVMRLGRLRRFRTLTYPVVFPYWVTGALTAAGGAWNASIIAEVARFGEHDLASYGLGALIAKYTVEGHWPGIVVSIVVMCLLVVLTNRLLWRRLYRYAEEHLRLED